MFMLSFILSFILYFFCEENEILLHLLNFLSWHYSSEYLLINIFQTTIYVIYFRVYIRLH